MCRKMKDSGVSWIGEIPADWSLKTIKQLMCERNEKNKDLEIKTILSLSAKNGVTLYDGENHSGNKPREDLSDYKIVRENDIVVNSMNILSGSVGLSRYTGVVSPVYYVYYPRYNDNIEFFHFLFQSYEFQRSLRGLGNGILIKETETGALNTIRIRIPSKKLGMQVFPVCTTEEQNKIVEFLRNKIQSIECLIYNQEKQIEKLTQYKQSLITETVTIGLNSNVETKDSGIDWIGCIPVHWNIARVRDFGIPQNGISKGGESFGSGYPFVSYGDVYRNLELPKEVAGLIETTEKEQETYSVQKGDIFFTRTSETIEEVGFSCVCNETIPMAVFAGFLIRLRPYNDMIHTSFAKYYFRGNHIRRYLVKEMNLVTRASLGQNLLKSMSILVPPKEEQIRIADYLDSQCSKIDSLIAIKQKKIEKLQQYKKSIIYEYVTGKKAVL